MVTRKITSVLAIAGLLAACEQSTTAPAEQTSAFVVQNALVGMGSSFEDGAGQPAIFGRLVHAAIAKIRHDGGDAAAEAARAQLGPLVAAVKAAREAGDTAAARTAMAALRQGEASIVVTAFGAEVVTRTIAFADAQSTKLDERIANAPANADLTRLRALAASIDQLVADAKAYAASGDNVSALISATKAVEALHIVVSHRPLEPRGSAPLDTTRVRHRP